MTEPTPDRFEKSLVLKATRDRVWRAITDSTEFGRWFGCSFRGPFVAGALTEGSLILPEHPDLHGLPMQLWVERIEPPSYFAFRWHPFAVERGVDYSHEPTTRVEFTLEDAPGGTLLRISESGFAQLPLLRRAKAFEMNSGGWQVQIERIARHVGGPGA